MGGGHGSLPPNEVLILCNLTKNNLLKLAVCMGLKLSLLGKIPKEGRSFMLTQAIADKIHTKVGSLVNQPLSVTDPHGTVLASNDPRVDESADTAKPWAIAISNDSQTA